jgi:hypothetical protein
MAVEKVLLLETLAPAALSAIGGFIGAWFAARFALSRFYRERTWERRADAYTAIFEALHDMEKWFDKHLESEQQARELSKDEVERLTEDYKKAGADLKRRVAKETWLISDNFRSRLVTLEEALSQRITYWPDFLETSYGALHSAFDDLRQIARSELSIGRRRFR